MSATARVLTGLVAGRFHAVRNCAYCASGNSTNTGCLRASSQASNGAMLPGAIAVQPAVASPGAFHRWAKMQLPPFATAPSALCSITKPSR